MFGSSTARGPANKINFLDFLKNNFFNLIKLGFNVNRTRTFLICNFNLKFPEKSARPWR